MLPFWNGQLEPFFFYFFNNLIPVFSNIVKLGITVVTDVATSHWPHKKTPYQPARDHVYSWPRMELFLLFPFGPVHFRHIASPYVLHYFFCWTKINVLTSNYISIKITFFQRSIIYFFYQNNIFFKLTVSKQLSLTKSIHRFNIKTSWN